MKSFLSTSLVVGVAAGAAINTVRQQTTSNCKLVSFIVNGSAQNKNLTGAPMTNITQINAFYANAKPIAVSGAQNITGTYCAPTVTNSNNTKLEVFFSTFLGNRGDWQALGGLGLDFPPYQADKYSWTQFANDLGYPTLSLDRLGTGRSSHPDPVNVVQAPYEGALYNDLARQLRTTNTQFQKYNTLIFIGNSYGSQLGALIAGAYPTAYDQYILTAYSKEIDRGFDGTSTIKPIPAKNVSMTRFGNLDKNYLTASNGTALTLSFFGSKAQVSYDDQAAKDFFDREDVVSVGSFLSAYARTYNATGFKGRVFVLTGEQDQVFCGPGSPSIGPAACGPLLGQTKTVFPDAIYNYKSVNNTGHALQFCNSAQKVFTIAHQFLNGQSFQGGSPA